MKVFIFFLFLGLLVMLTSHYFKYDKDSMDVTSVSVVNIKELRAPPYSKSTAYKKSEVVDYSSSMEMEYDVADEVCCAGISIASYFQDETEFKDYEIKSLIDSIVKSVRSDPSLVYTYLYEYTYTSDINASEFYSTVILEAGDYNIVSDYIYRTFEASNSGYALNMVSLAAHFLKDKDRSEFFKTVSESKLPSTERAIAIISLIEPDWNDLDTYIENYVIPSLDSNNDEESFVAMTKLAGLSSESDYLDYLIEIIDGPPGPKRDMALLALEYAPQQE